MYVWRPLGLQAAYGIIPNMSTLRTKQEVALYLQQAAAKYVDRAVEVAVDIMGDDTLKPADRMTAVKFITDRAAGKPSQEFTIDMPDDEEMDERMALAEAQTREVLLLPAPTLVAMDNVIPINQKKKRRVKL